MSAVLDTLAWLCAHGPTLLLGVTVVLLGGTIAMTLHRAPAQRRRLGITTAIGAFVYLGVAVAPLPRCTLRDAPSETIGPSMQASLLPVPDADTRAARLLAAMRTLDVDAAAAAHDDPAAPAAAVDERRTTAPAARPAARPAAFVATQPARRGGLEGWLASFSWQLALAAAYAFGVVCMVLRGLGGYLRLRRLLATCRAAPLPPGVHLPRGTKLLVAPAPVRPFCAGLWQPIVVLPHELLAPARSAEAGAVLRHEAAHVRAGDSRVQTLLALLAVPLFCHPLFWWLCREVRFCSELLADDAAAAEGRHHYARALIDLAERDQPQLVANGTVAVFHRPSEFYRRIQMLLQREAPLCTSTSRLRRFTHAFAMLCLVGTAASLFGVPAAAQDPTGRSMRKENAELRETIETLRAELTDLRRQIQELGETHARAEHGGAIDSLLRAANEAKSHDARDAQDLDRVFEQLRAASRNGALGTMANDEQLREQLRAASSGPRSGLAPQQPAPAAATPPPTDVPVLGELPMIGNLFRSEADQQDPGRRDAAAPARTYTVRKGDSIERIARTTLGSDAGVGPLLELNPGLDPSRLRVGQKLALPPATPPPGLPSPLGLPPAAGTPQPGNPFGGGAAPPDGPLAAFPGMMPPEPPAAMAPQPTGAAALADLTSRYLDLQAELEIAELTAAETKALAESGQAPQREARQAVVNLRSLHKKFEIAQRLVDGEIAATEQELAWIEQKRQQSDPTEGLRLDMQASRARTRLDALHSVK